MRPVPTRPRGDAASPQPVWAFSGTQLVAQSFTVPGWTDAEQQRFLARHRMGTVTATMDFILFEEKE